MRKFGLLEILACGFFILFGAYIFGYGLAALAKLFEKLRGK